MATSAKKSTAAAKKNGSAPSKPGSKPKGAAANAVKIAAKSAKSAVAKVASAAKAATGKKAAPAGAAPTAAKTAAKGAPAKGSSKAGTTAASKAPPAKPQAETVPAVAPESAVGATSAAAAGPKQPPPPRLTVRTPAGADELKQKIGALATATAQIRGLKRSIQKSFYDIGLILKDIDDRKLYEVKGYGSFEAFLEREIDLGKQLGMRLARTVQVFQKDAALQAGLERVSAAIAVLDGEVDPSAAPPAASPTSSGGARSPIPFHKQ